MGVLIGVVQLRREPTAVTAVRPDRGPKQIHGLLRCPVFGLALPLVELLPQEIIRAGLCPAPALALLCGVATAAISVGSVAARTAAITAIATAVAAAIAAASAFRRLGRLLRLFTAGDADAVKHRRMYFNEPLRRHLAVSPHAIPHHEAVVPIPVAPERAATTTPRGHGTTNPAPPTTLGPHRHRLLW